jgi:GGDEF domain-containing protein
VPSAESAGERRPPEPTERRPPEWPVAPVSPGGRGLSELAASFPAVEWYRGGHRQARAAASGEIQVPRSAGEAVGAVLRPDPVTGLAGLPSVLVQLGSAVGALRSVVTGAVAVVLIDVAERDPAGPLLPDEAYGAVAERLRGHVRSNDVVGRIGHGTFAIVASVRHGEDDGPVIERRLLDAARGALGAAPAGEVRSALATASASSAVSPEELMREAITRLGAR